MSASGNVSIGGHLYYVGRTDLEETVSVRFIRERRCFCFQLAGGTLIAELPVMGLDKADLIGYMPIEEALPMTFQLPLPLEGV